MRYIEKLNNSRLCHNISTFHAEQRFIAREVFSTYIFSGLLWALASLLSIRHLVFETFLKFYLQPIVLGPLG